MTEETIEQTQIEQNQSSASDNPNQKKENEPEIKQNQKTVTESQLKAYLKQAVKRRKELESEIQHLNELY